MKLLFKPQRWHVWGALTLLSLIIQCHLLYQMIALHRPVDAWFGGLLVWYGGMTLTLSAFTWKAGK